MTETRDSEFFALACRANPPFSISDKIGKPAAKGWIAQRVPVALVQSLCQMKN